mgnify:CR=1 FL=1
MILYINLMYKYVDVKCLQNVSLVVEKQNKHF